mgnify:CR=1 FL=1
MLLPLILMAIAVLAATFPMLPFANRYLIVVAILILIYVMLGWGLNVVVGLAGRQSQLFGWNGRCASKTIEDTHALQLPL